MTKIIGLTGRAGAGKDTAASLFEDEAVMLSFAKPLKEAVQILFNFTYDQLYDPIKKEEIDVRWGKSPRQILQYIGTNVLRENINKDIFIINMEERIKEAMKLSKKYIFITDVRFDNEACLIKALGGHVLEIVRDTTSTIHTDHPTEQGISDFLVDARIYNDGSIEDLRNKILSKLI
jgi:hypothetical protein